MTWTGTFCVEDDVKAKHGSAIVAAVNTAMRQRFVKMAEGSICLIIRKDLVTGYATVSTIGKEALRDICSNLAAAHCISYSAKDITTETSRIEAETRMSLLWARWREQAKMLMDTNFSKFLTEA
jgi:hypothetical protein